MGASPSKGRPEACASRCLTVEPGGPGGLVEVDRPLLGRDEHRERGDELRHRGPAEDVTVIAVPAEDPARRYRRRSRMLGSPVLDLTQGFHRGDTTTRMEPWSHDFRGRLDEHVFESEVLKDNPLGDPSARPLWVYVPPGYDDDPDRRYPSVYVIQGMTGQIDMWRNRAPWRKNFPELADDLLASGDCPPCILVYVDCWTSLGGSQFLDSPGTGPLPHVPLRRGGPVGGRDLPHPGRRREPRHRRQVERRLRRDGDADAPAGRLRRAGHPRGGRALRDVLPPGVPRGRAGAPRRLRRLVREVLGGLPLAPGVLEEERLPPRQQLHDGRVLLGRGGRDGHAARSTRRPASSCPTCGSAGSPGTRFGWFPGCADALRSQKAIYIDAGKRDEFYLDLGAEAFRRALEEIGVSDVYFELFDATHMAIEYRYPLSLKYLAERLS